MCANSDTTVLRALFIDCLFAAPRSFIHSITASNSFGTATCGSSRSFPSCSKARAPPVSHAALPRDPFQYYLEVLGLEVRYTIRVMKGCLRGFVGQDFDERALFTRQFKESVPRPTQPQKLSTRQSHQVTRLQFANSGSGDVGVQELKSRHDYVTGIDFRTCVHHDGLSRLVASSLIATILEPFMAYY